ASIVVEAPATSTSPRLPTAVIFPSTATTMLASRIGWRKSPESSNPMLRMTNLFAPPAGLASSFAMGRRPFDAECHSSADFFFADREECDYFARPLVYKFADGRRFPGQFTRPVPKISKANSCMTLNCVREQGKLHQTSSLLQGHTLRDDIIFWEVDT